MLEKLPAGVGQALRTTRPGLDQILFYDADLSGEVAPIEVKSAAFAHLGELPARYTDDGEGMSPPLAWGEIAPAAQSLILIIEDADSPTPAPLVHAIVWNLAPQSGALDEGALAGGANEGVGLAMGKNSFLCAKYLAPDPPPGHGPHRYAFQLFALDSRPELGDNPGRQRIAEHLKGRVVAKGLLIGTYERL